MSEASRQRYLHRKNRLEELEWKYGPLEKPPTPEWLESLDGWYAYTARQAAQDEAEATPPVLPTPPATEPPPAQNRVPRRPPDGLGPKGPGW